MVSCLACLTVLPGWGQLIGSRGVISLRPGQLYRDRLTVEASQVAARLALLLDREERRAGRHQAFRWRTTSDFKYPQQQPPSMFCFAGFPTERPRQSTRQCWEGLLELGELWRTARYSTITTVGLSGLHQPSSSTCRWRRWRWSEPPVPPGLSRGRGFPQAFTRDLHGLQTDWLTWLYLPSPHREQRMPSSELSSTAPSPHSSPSHSSHI